MDDLPVFNYVASIQGREFIVTILENRMSQWDDLSGCGLAHRLQDEQSDGVISVRVSDKFLRGPRRWSEKKRPKRLGQGNSKCLRERRRMTSSKWTVCLKISFGGR